MASKSKAQKSDAAAEAAVDYFAARSHDAWRRNFWKTNPKEKNKPRMRMRGGVMVDINQPWSQLHPKAKADNKVAGYDAYDAVKKFPKDREAAAAYVHERWIKRNKKDPNQPKDLFKPYAQLPEIEKDKDRVHVDGMAEAMAAVRKRALKKAPVKKAKSKAKRANTKLTVEVDAATWRRLESLAKQLSVSPDLLLSASVEAMAALNKATKGRAKKS